MSRRQREKNANRPDCAVLSCRAPAKHGHLCVRHTLKRAGLTSCLPSSLRRLAIDRATMQQEFDDAMNCLGASGDQTLEAWRRAVDATETSSLRLSEALSRETREQRRVFMAGGRN